MYSGFALNQSVFFFSVCLVPHAYDFPTVFNDPGQAGRLYSNLSHLRALGENFPPSLFPPSAPSSATGCPPGIEAKCHQRGLAERSLSWCQKTWV